MVTPVLLDGARFSGSGTIVRFGVALSAVTGRELHIINVRARRHRPGLRPQHLTAVRAVAEMCGAELRGDRLDSTELVFVPHHPPRGGEYEWDIGTAGSATMLALALLPVAVFADGPCTFRITGGLFQDFAPSALHMKFGLLPVLRQMGFRAELEILRPGYVPSGGGIVRLDTEPAPEGLRALVWMEQPSRWQVWGYALSSHLRDRQVSARMAEACRRALLRQGLEAIIDVHYDDTAVQPGAALAVFAHGDGALIGADMAGAPRRRAEFIGEQVARMLMEDISSGATVDRHLADQLVIFAGLALGETCYRAPAMTEHLGANLWLVREVLGAQARVDGREVRVVGNPLGLVD